MREINTAAADVAAVASRLEQLSPNIPGFGSVDPAWTRPPAVLVIDCVLSLNRNYDKFLVPRLETFMSNHSEIQRVTDLAKLMAGYPTPHAFVQKELNYNHESRAKTLQAVLKFVCQIVEGTQTIEEEKEILRQWAIQAEPPDYQTLNIRGFAIAGFQYLRMLFGADTTKPDVHIIGFLSDLLNRRVSEVEALRLLEAASKRVALSVRDVDTYIWQIRARGQQKAPATTTLNDELRLGYSETSLKGETRGKYTNQYTAGTNIVRLEPDIAAAFPAEEAVNEALRFVATFDYTYKPVSTSSLAFRVAERCWWRKTSNKNLVNMFDTSIEKLKSLLDTDMYKQSVFNLMCVQRSEQEFEEWVQGYDRMAYLFSERMKLDKANHAKMLAGVRAFHTAAKEGVKVKVMKQRQDPYKV